MGGGGKTTLARVVFDHISFQFEGSSFVENVRENSIPNFSGLKKLQKQVLKDVLNDRGINISSVHDGKKMMKKMMHCRKVLVVLDDVDHTKQLEALAGELNWFNKGSRIIITTRDEQVLIAHRVNLIRDVNLLSHEEALCLFSRYAFGREIPIQGYEELSSQVVLYAAGLPLTVSVLGSFLCGKIEVEWESAIQRLKTIPSKDTLDILEISYIGLEEEHKEIFLDVACILKGWEKEDAIRALESCGFYARIGLKVLEQKSLITISKYGELDMHDRIEEMGKYIVRRTHEQPNKHSRLWIKQEIEDILVSDKGTNEAIRCIKIMKTSKLNPEFVMKGLGNMKKLRFLQMWRGDNNWEFDEVWQYFPNALRCLRWTQLPPLFSKCKIVQLRQGGDRKVLNNLRFLDISGSKLKNLDLGLTPNLERLYITYCYYLVELHMPAECPKLISLKLGYSKLTTLVFPKTPNLETLSVLSCYDLVELHIPIQCLNLKSIYINGSRVRTLDLRGTPNLETLSVVECSHLEELHISVKYLKLKSICICNSKLRTLDLQGTLNLETLTLEQCVDLQLHIPVKCLKLKSIDIYNSKLRTLDLQGTLNLERLSVKGSYDLVQLHTPVECLKLESIDICGSKLRTLDLRAAQNLKVLTVKGCYDLVELHTPVACLKLESIDIDGSKLRTLDLRAAQNLKILTVKGCYDLVELHTPVECLKLESIVIDGSKLRILDLRAAQNLKCVYFNYKQSLTAPAYMPREETNGSGKPKDSGSAIQVDRSSDDGYNWRKYGQKVVKGGEHTRSYYKCTHPNCEVKKISERPYTGQITEIVYKGTHDHPKPQPSRRFSAGALMSIQEENADKVQYATYQAGLSNNGQNPNFEASGTPVQSPRQGNQDSTDGSARQLNRTNDEVDDDDDPYSKKRRTDFGALDVTPVVKPIREPRVVVQTTSEVDILDDGYRWRKYGQKVVRGNPNPRSYYKCTSAGCTVRKHVERASHDPKAVITAYEGKHNHDVPVVKNSSHDATISGISRTRSEENDALCLDLVVGNRIPDQQPPQNAATLHSQVHVSNSNFRKVVHWNDVYGTTTDNEVEGCNIDSTTLNHSSNPYPQNLGRILLGP